MEVFNVHSCSEELIDLKSDTQLESLLNMIKDSKEVMIKWEEEDEDGDMMKKSKILITDELLVKLKDGRLVLTSSKEKEE